MEILVMMHNGIFRTVDPQELDRLLDHGQVRLFERSDGLVWATDGPLRQSDRPFNGAERRRRPAPPLNTNPPEQ